MADLIDGRYRLGEVIASGGMATVWRAVDTRLNRDVALKRPHPSSAGDPVRRRFRREAKTAAGLSHPNVITVYDAGEDAEGPYLVMELVEGPTLAESTPDPASAITIGADLAAALTEVHAAGITHRDIKPSNVILSARGPLLTDFGIAIAPDNTADLTLPGQVLATPGYAAPEVLTGSTATPASDVYSLAVLVHEIATGTGPPLQKPLETLGDRAIDATMIAAMSLDPASRPDALSFADVFRNARISTRQILPASPPTAVANRNVQTVSMPHLAAQSEVTEPANQPTGFGWWRLALRVLVVTALISGSFFTAYALTASEPARSEDVEATLVPTSAPAVPLTSPPATSPPVSEPPITLTIRIVTTTTAPPLDPIYEAANELTTFIGSVGPPDLKPKTQREIIDRVARLIEQPEDDGARQLRELERRIRDIDNRGGRETALELLDDLAGFLDIRTNNDDGD